MKQVTSAANIAGAQSSCARNKNAPAFPPVARRALLPAVRTIRQDLGLSTGDLLVLDALLSFLPCRDRTGEERPITPDLMLVVFASNAALAERANGMEERVLRRHIARLCEAGLLRRKMSATGKRFPLKSGGVIRDAFGLDLTPLLERHQELTHRAANARLRDEELRSVRAEALALRAQAVALGNGIGEEGVRYLDAVKTFLRRATLTLDQVRDLIERIKSLLSGSPSPVCPRASAADTAPPEGASALKPDQAATHPAKQVQAKQTERTTRPAPAADTSVEAYRLKTDTDEMSGGNGHYVRQEESYQIENKKRGPSLTLSDIWSGCRELASFYPDPPGSETDLIRIIYDFGKMLNIKDRPLAGALHRIGSTRMIQALDYLAQNVMRINRPESYLDRMIRDLENGKPVGWAR